MTTCSTPDCDKTPRGNRALCDAYSSRKFRTPMERMDAELREWRAVLKASDWDRHVAATPRPPRNLAWGWR